MPSSQQQSPPLLDAYATNRCEVRLQHSLDTSIDQQMRREFSEAELRRINGGKEYREEVLAELGSLLGLSVTVIKEDERQVAQEKTSEALEAGANVIVGAWLLADEIHGRIGRPDLLVKTIDGYLPVMVKLHLLSQAGTGSLEYSPLTSPFPAQSRTELGTRFRKGSTWVNDALQLMHVHRMLDHLGYAARTEGLLGGIIDGSRHLWWMSRDAAVARDGLSIADLYDQRFEERMALAKATVARNDDPSLPRARSPWWHKECERCPYSELCRHELESTDDVSLVRWVSQDVLDKLRSAGVRTRSDLAKLDLVLTDLAERLRDTTMPLPVVIERARDADLSLELEELVGSRMGVRRHIAKSGMVTVGDLLGRDAVTRELLPHVHDLGRLVRRARAHLAGGVVLQVDPDHLTACRGDIEIDVDMESYDHATYLWGTYLSSQHSIPDLEEGYRSFVTFDPLTLETEAGIFLEFWKWLSGIRSRAASLNYSIRVYCFWKPAEEGQMLRAASRGGDAMPSVRTLRRFFSSHEWVDLHQLARDQLITEGPLGLKALATRAGFSWRDEDPSGEASIAWYEEATRGGSTAARERLLAYNEDDVLATRALREWLDSSARLLPQVHDIAVGD